MKLEVNVSHQLPDRLKVSTALTTPLAVSSCLCQVIACHTCTTLCHSFTTQLLNTCLPDFQHVQSYVAPWPDLTFCLAQINSTTSALHPQDVHACLTTGYSNTGNATLLVDPSAVR